VDLINQHSPRFVAALIAEDADAQEAFYRSVDAPFVGDGFTRWVDGQYALNEPELGLSNWEFGRPLGRSAVLTGASVHTIRLRMRQSDLSVRR
jgi:glutamate-5-semialdehyde dehydrogenase